MFSVTNLIRAVKSLINCSEFTLFFRSSCTCWSKALASFAFSLVIVSLVY
ncbi:hypothetical protein EVA_02202 [gut metagenome]|uniref:Uncharacterized protein n=1 Tax=gut metagenome TaxID=749906 RepID=J9GPM7_9ZZZZ